MQALPTVAISIRCAPGMIERLDLLTTYCEGWSKGDADMIRSAVADDYVWDDPAEGRVSKDGLGSFLPKFKEAIDRVRGVCPSTSYLTLSDWAVDRSQLTTTVWCSFAVPGTDIQGMSQIRVADKGVISEHRAYRTSLPVRVAGIRGKRSALERRNRSILGISKNLEPR